MTETAPRPTPEHPEVTTCGPVPGYSRDIGRYVAQLTEVRQDLLRDLDKLTTAQLDWHPNDQTESIGTQLLHVAAIEWSWIFQDIFGRPDEAYDGWEEAFPIRVGAPQVTGQPLAYFTDRLERVRGEVLEALRGLNDDDLDRLVGEGPPPEDVAPRSYLFSIDWILFHLVHHEARHVGQVELLRRLLPADLAGTRFGA